MPCNRRVGVAISWVAVRGKDPQDVLNYLGLGASGEREDIPEAPSFRAILEPDCGSCNKNLKERRCGR
jgi:hypothetical protein